MREKLIEMLKYPRFLVDGSFDLTHCSHNRFFNQVDARCLRCDNGAECEWLYKNEGYVAFAEKSEAELLESLEFGINYITAMIDERTHTTLACQCDACLWLQQAQVIMDTYTQPRHHG